MKFLRIAFAAFLFNAITTAACADPQQLLNASYDPTREFYHDYNKLFAEHWRKEGGGDVTVQQSHGGSGKQARAVIDGLEADVVTLALAYDIDAIAERSGRLPADWQGKFPRASTPYVSTIVFLVRKGNPKKIKDWDDLVRDGVQVITPNPKTSGGARWNYLAAWGYGLKVTANDEPKTRDFLVKLFKNVPVLDTGARGATTTFAQRGIGDVLIGWENEAYLAIQELGADKFEMVYPSLSIRAEPPVAVVEQVAKKHKTEKLAHEYLNYLYSAPAQELAAKHFYRPGDAAVLAKYKDKFPELPMVSISDFGGWQAAQKKHFDDGGVFDQLYGKK